MKDLKCSKISSFWAGALLATSLVTGSTTAQAGVFDTIFEMDGNPNAVAGSPSDWEDLYNNGDALVKLVPIPDRVGLPGFIGPDNMFHHGCKDVNDLLNCYVKAADKTLPDKDDYENGSIALYTLSGLAAPVPIDGLPGGMSGFHQNGDLIIVMQGDIYAPNGDASLGGWFFQNQIPAPAPGEAFSVGRENGDIFIEADFTGGGSDVSFAVYKWDTGVKKNVQQLISGEGLRCGDIPNPLGCAISNDETIGPVDTVWPYIAKGDAAADPYSDQYPTTTFFEGVFNFSAILRLLGLNEGCYTNFLYETRASHSIDAKLHDYILGSIPMCDVSVTKTGPTQSKPTDETQYTITIENTGVVPLTESSISDTLLGDLSGECEDTLSVGEICTINVNRTVLATDPDPLPNTVTAIYNYGSDSVQDSASHSVDLFVPGINISKTGTATSKAGDDVTYNFTITNLTDGDPSTPAYDGSAPNMLLTSINDTLLGDLSAYAGAAGCNTLALGGSCSFSVTRTVLATDPDPTPNTVTVHYSPDGFPNDIPDSDSHSVDLFAPAVEIVKTGETVSKAGDAVTYQFTINNKSDGDLTTAALDGTAPDLVLDTINDTVMGSLLTQATAAGCGTLSLGGSCNFSVVRTVLETDPDPLNNTVTVHYHPVDFDNDVADSDSHSVDLFAPAVQIVKTGETISKATDDVTYQFTITNLTDGNLNTAAIDGTAPDLQLATISDSLLGNLATPANAAGCGTLALGASCNFQVVRTVLATDPDPLNNTVDVLYHPAGFPNNITDSDSHSVDLFAPAVKIVKTGDSVSKATDDVTYTFTITNESDGNLNTAALDGVAPNLQLATISDTLLGDLATPANAAGCGSLPLGGSCNFQIVRTVLATDPDPLNNTVNVLYHPAGFPNNITDSDSHSVDLFAPAVEIVKTGDTLSKATDDVTYTFTITNKSDGDLTTAALDGTAPNLTLASITDSVIGSLASQATTAGCGTLPLGASCTFQVTRTVQGTDPDPLNNTVNVLYHPAGFPNNVADSDSHSVNLFQPEWTLSKVCKDPSDGDSEVVVGQDAQFVFTLNNTSSGDTPALNLVSATDTLLGNIASQLPDPLPLGESTVSINYTTMIPGVLSNTVDVTYSPAGFPNQLSQNDSASCTVVPGDEGCTPGYWKNHPEQWDGVTPDATSSITYNMLFNATFGVTAAQSGLADTVTLMDAVNLEGGGLMALNRHAAAALPSADSVEYSYSVAGVIHIYQDAVGAIAGPESIYSALAKLSAANEKDCPLN